MYMGSALQSDRQINVAKGHAGIPMNLFSERSGFNEYEWPNVAKPAGIQSRKGNLGIQFAIKVLTCWW